MPDKRQEERQESGQDKRFWSSIVVATRRAKIVCEFFNMFETAVSWKWVSVMFGTVIAWTYTTAPVALPWIVRGILVAASLWLIWTGWTGARTAIAKIRQQGSSPRPTGRTFISVTQAIDVAKQSSAVLYRLPRPVDGDPRNTVRNEKAKYELARDLVRRFMAANPDAVGRGPHPVFGEDGIQEVVEESRFWAFVDRESVRLIDRVAGLTELQ